MIHAVVKSIDRTIGRTNVALSGAIADDALQRGFLDYARCSIRLTIRSQVSLNEPRRVAIDTWCAVIVFIALGVSGHTFLPEIRC